MFEDHMVYKVTHKNYILRLYKWRTYIIPIPQQNNTSHVRLNPWRASNTQKLVRILGDYASSLKLEGILINFRKEIT